MRIRPRRSARSGTCQKRAQAARARRRSRAAGGSPGPGWREVLAMMAGRFIEVERGRNLALGRAGLCLEEGPRVRAGGRALVADLEEPDLRQGRPGLAARVAVGEQVAVAEALVAVSGVGPRLQLVIDDVLAEPAGEAGGVLGVDALAHDALGAVGVGEPGPGDGVVV